MSTKSDHNPNSKSDLEIVLYDSHFIQYFFFIFKISDFLCLETV